MPVVSSLDSLKELGIGGKREQELQFVLRFMLGVRVG